MGNTTVPDRPSVAAAPKRPRRQRRTIPKEAPVTTTIRVLGIDPAYRNFGMVLADVDPTTGAIVGTPELRLVTTETGKEKKGVRKSSDDLRRCRVLVEGLRAMVAKADVVCAEMPLGSQSATAMKGVGVCMGLLAAIDKPLIELTPDEVKLAAVGKSTATKAAMIEWAHARHPDANWLRLNDKPTGRLLSANEHLADAVAVVEAASKTDQFKLLAVGFAAFAAR